MKKLKLSIKLKQIVSIVFLLLSVSFFILLIANKKNMENYASQLMKKQTTEATKESTKSVVDSLYNYQKNGSKHKITFLEFGATGCSACKRMETVMAEIREKYPQEVNVIFLNVLLPESQIMMKYFGIAAIPTQVLLDKNGKEFFRHTGYFSEKELAKTLTIKNIN
ncbi:MAG: hypothetical protein BGN96_12330 [Bacteroidales bacterium 45-6]|uniref:TlpA family protein disulfide reductase n=1 Tax=uncultured Dysgonomonas sp. TaxID=206096 RepID=UPI000959F020|nr:thioredoxin family protein [uncultured Dysgonomonas sp.]OJU55604.1 MAG: hypothetical protein BGN96_12330 [Bacteroidales bacterium 45-6]